MLESDTAVGVNVESDTAAGVNGEPDTAVGVNGDSRMARVAYMGRAACMARGPNARCRKRGKERIHR